MRYVNATLKASFLFNKNIHYLVRDQQVLLIDEHTGRTMAGRRMSEGIHQALECKENVIIQRESQTLASTTYQNFFRLFNKLSGMTGTADTEAAEFAEIYGLNVSIIPTNKPMAREDNDDLVFLTQDSKFKALIDEIETLRKKDAPVLVSKGKVIAEGFSEELDKLRNLRNKSQSHLDEMLERETERTQIPSLKISFNNVFGYYIEVRNTHKDKVPEEWIRKQTLVNAERYITEELKVYEQKILGAEEKIMSLETRLFQELVIEMASYITSILVHAQILGFNMLL